MTNYSNASGQILGTLDPIKNVTLTESTTLAFADLGQMFNIATDAIVQTLPLSTTIPEGTRVGFRNTGADGNNLIAISPDALDGVFGTIANSAADSVASGTVDKDLINTKTTANKGDYVVLECDGATGWYIIGGVGIWASEA